MRVTRKLEAICRVPEYIPVLGSIEEKPVYYRTIIQSVLEKIIQFRSELIFKTNRNRDVMLENCTFSCHFVGNL
jgi:hypothetical protein